MARVVVSDKVGTWGTRGARFSPGIYTVTNEDVLEAAKAAPFGVAVIEGGGDVPDISFPAIGALPPSNLLTKADFSRIAGVTTLTARDGMEFASLYALAKYNELNGWGDDDPTQQLMSSGLGQHVLPGPAAQAIRTGYHDEATRGMLNQRIAASGGLVTPDELELIQELPPAPVEFSSGTVPTPEEADEMLDLASEAPQTEPEVVDSRLSTSAATPAPPTLQQAEQTTPEDHAEQQGRHQDPEKAPGTQSEKDEPTTAAERRAQQRRAQGAQDSDDDKASAEEPK
jgi:hypothetical protein